MSTITPDLQVVRHPGEPTERIMTQFGFPDEPDPEWSAKLLPPERLEWLLDRWDASTRTFRFGNDDTVSLLHRGGYQHKPELVLVGLAPPVVLEVLTGLARDQWANNTHIIHILRMLSNRLTESSAHSLAHLTRDQLGGMAVTQRWMTWTKMLHFASADQEQEWLSDEVRVAVIKPTDTTEQVLQLGGVRQGWLRDLLVDFLRIRAPQVGTGTLRAYAWSVTLLSQYLATRADEGENPRQLTMKTMQQYTEHLGQRDDLATTRQHDAMTSLAAVLTEARALDLTTRHGLPTSFTVRPEHKPTLPVQDRVEKAMPLAAFCLLMGQDQHLGASVFDLLASFKKDPLDGLVQVRLETFMGNFGRRLGEGTKIMCDRIRFDDHGGAALLYDDFKTGRERVWLPITATEVEPLREWVAQLRDRWPDTPLEDLRLFPKAKSRNGTEPVSSTIASYLHSFWVRTLEQAIIIAKTHQATGADLASLCQLTCAAPDGDQLTVADTRYTLDPATRNMLVDYRTQLLNWVEGAVYFPGEELMPLFPKWKDGSRTARDRAGKPAYRPVAPQMFAPLGADWVERAVRYLSPGLPGGSFGKERVGPDELFIERNRHTYLQHLYNASRDIHLVSELAGHANVGVTFNAYVTGHDQLREAVDLCSQYRQDLFGHARAGTLPLASIAAPGIPVNCERPQVLQLGVEGCHKDRQCFRCEHYSADPSNLRDIEREIATALKAVATAEAEPDDEVRNANILVLKSRIKGWKEMRQNLRDLMGALPAQERERLELACQVVQEFRDQVRGGGPTAGTVLSQMEAAR